MKSISFYGLLCICLLLFGAGLAVPTVPVAAGNEAAWQSGPAAEIFQRVNQVRADHGLPLWQFNHALAAAAQNHANWMAANVIFDSHVGAGGSTPLSRANAAGYYGAVSENIVGGWQMTPGQGVIWWLNSAPHYRTLTSSRYIEVGTAFAHNAEVNVNMYVLVVGLPDGASPPVPGGADPDPEANPAPIFMTPIELSPPQVDGSITHVVQDGQALWSIAAYYEVDLDFIMLINHLTPGDFVQTGDEILVRLADGQPIPPTSTPPFHHIVQPGDSIWSIAVLYDQTVEQLNLINQLGVTSILLPGDEVRIRLAPGESLPPTPTPKLTYQVLAGDSAWSIAARFGLSLDEFRLWNGFDEATILRPGDEVIIRAPVTAEPTVAATPFPPTFTPVATGGPGATAPAPVAGDVTPTAMVATASAEIAANGTPAAPEMLPTALVSDVEEPAEPQSYWGLWLVLGLVVAGLLVAGRRV